MGAHTAAFQNAGEVGSGVAGRPRYGMLSYKPVGAIVSGLAVLRHLAHAPGPMPLVQITRELGLNPSTCLNILRTLAEEKYIVFDRSSKQYAMGAGALELVGGAAAQRRELRSVTALTDQIAVVRSVTVTLWRRIQHDRMLLVLESLPDDNLSIGLNVGQRLPLLVGAAGKVMAAFSNLGTEELARQFSQLRLSRQQTFSQFMDDVQTSREQGFAVDDGLFTYGATSISVPVLDEANRAVFALSATTFTPTFSHDLAVKLRDELSKPAALLSSALPHL